MKRNLFIIIFILSINLSAFAFKFSPMSTTIGIGPNDNSALFFLENDSDQAIAVQVSLAKREMDIFGVEANAIVGSELTLYPTQLIIPPNEKRSVKVLWSGKDQLTKELAYRLIAEQLPIELEKDKSKKASIKVLLRYIAALYVKPADLNSDISITDFKVVDKKFIIATINKGKKHQVMTNLMIKFIDEAKNKEVLFKSEELKGINGENILADSQRLFIFPNLGKFSEIGVNDKVKMSFDKD